MLPPKKKKYHNVGKKALYPYTMSCCVRIDCIRPQLVTIIPIRTIVMTKDSEIFTVRQGAQQSSGGNAAIRQPFGGFCLRTSLLVLFLFSPTSCNYRPGIPILDPGGTPNVTKKKWKSLEIRYGFLTGEGTRDVVKRSFVISGADLDSLQRRFNPEKIRGMSTGSSAKSKLTLVGGEVWLFMVIDPQDMRVCSETNKKLHYTMKFGDLQFYDALRELCWKNELTITPDVKIENIFLGFDGVNMHPDERPLVQPYLDEVVQ